MPLKSFEGPLPALTPWARGGMRYALRRHVEKLAGEIGERNVYQTEEASRCGGLH